MTKHSQAMERIAALADPQAFKLLADAAETIAGHKPGAAVHQAFAEACARAGELGLRNRNGRVTAADVAEALGADPRLSQLEQGQGASGAATAKPARKPARKRQ